MLEDFIHEPRIAYFSMKIALQNEIPHYTGGFGMLAGDILRSATWDTASLAQPLDAKIAVPLLRKG